MSLEALQAANEDLRARLEQAEETIQAIQQGAVDAFVLEELGRKRVYTLEGADRPYRLFVEEMNQGVATLHGDATVLYGNRSLARLLDVPPRDLAGSDLRDFVHEDDRHRFEDLFAEGRSRSAAGEVRLVRAGGAIVPVGLTLTALPAESGKLVGAFVTDLTEQKEHQQLAAAQQALRDADRRKDEFLAMLAHELRGPLAPLGNMLEIMKRAGGNTELLQQARGTMERQLSQLVRLVDDLLDVSRITLGKLELRKERMDLSAILNRVVETSRAWSAGIEHEVDIRVPEEPIYLDADPTRLTQVFNNLFHNACKYTEPTGRIWLSAESTGGDGRPFQAVVRIKDTGMGIPPERIPGIFDAFVQVDRSLERSQGGLGIGLTLVRRLVEMHGGSVSARSEGLGRGSEFTVRLPLDPAVRAAASEGAPTAAERLEGPRRFLVVDDNQDSTASLAMLLSIEGHETRTARDGLEAIAAAEAFGPDVVLLDIGLPKLNGFETARRIRGQPWGKDLALIALTGWGQDEDRRRSKEAGFDGHMVKPIDFDALMHLLETLTARRKTI